MSAFSCTGMPMRSASRARRERRAPSIRYRAPSAAATWRTSRPTASHLECSAAAVGRTPAASAAAVLVSTSEAAPRAIARSVASSSPSSAPSMSAAKASLKRASASAASTEERVYASPPAAPALEALLCRSDSPVPGLRRRRPAVRSLILSVTPAASEPARLRRARPPSSCSPFASSSGCAPLVARRRRLPPNSAAEVAAPRASTTRW
mmetsp:Transcript_4224/g.13578  ORF Transcript_4224/g.13578 Transcript_4224/m.13578 type:complete len:208 (+) Transcript_4224:5674-6297(+)